MEITADDVIRETGGGASVAACPLHADLANLRKDVERIARSAVMSLLIAGEGKK
ncbi:MAG TPA: hypothetical protein VG013_13165 [Gemmataceae bacterium]|nr:hypothetical protein [Gemmataceae bacterium]